MADLIVHSDVEEIEGPLNCVRAHGIKVIRKVDANDESRLTKDEVHMIWGMPHYWWFHWQIHTSRQHFHIENGWLTPNRSICLDNRGTNGLSTCRAAINDDSPVDKEKVDKHVSFVHRIAEVENAHCNDEKPGYVFVPLQVEIDSQLRHWSNINAEPWGDVGKRQVKLVNDVCEAFPDRRIIVRPHPSDPSLIENIKNNCEGFRAHGNVFLDEMVGKGSDNSYQWLSRAGLVVGINSTVLTEAVTFGLPVLAVGQGIFTGNGVICEMGECDPQVMRENAEYRPNLHRIDQYLTFLLKRQLSKSIQPGEEVNHPILKLLIDTCLHWPDLPDWIMEQGPPYLGPNDPRGIDAAVKTEKPTLGGAA